MVLETCAFSGLQVSYLQVRNVLASEITWISRINMIPHE